MKALPKKSSLIEIAVTIGDPASIGPEVGMKALNNVIGKFRNCQIHLFAPGALVPKSLHKKIQIHDPEPSEKFIAGKGSIETGARALRDLDRAINFCLEKSGRSLVTGPIDKSLCARTQPGFTGHTDYLQSKTRSSGTTMLLAGSKLRIALVTTHLPLRDVSKSLTTSAIVSTGTRLHNYLMTIVRKPKLAVLGLNPHASDHGLFGDEEENVILPALSALKNANIDASGPYSPDSFFHRSKDFDGVICMYHDQGLIPLKMIHFYDAVNITLGLPFLRVSVDHGTAFDIAGKKKASSLSYVNALITAYSFSKKSRSD